MYKIGICDSITEYGMGLADYLSQNDSNMGVTVFSGLNEVEIYLKDKDLDLILTDDILRCCTEEEPEGGSIKFHGVKCIYLYDGREKLPDDGNLSSEVVGRNKIFKYRNLMTIYAEIKNLIKPASNCGNVYTTEAVFSPIGRSGCTTLAKALAMYDSVRGGLYIGMENYCGDVNSNCEILYQIKERFPDIAEGLKGSAHVNAKQYTSVNACYVYQDLRNVNKNDMDWFIEKLLQCGSFSTVVFDLGSGVLDDFRILNCFDRIYIPVLSDDISERKISAFENVLRRSDMRDIISKIIKVNVPVGASDDEMLTFIWRLKNMKNEEF